MRGFLVYAAESWETGDGIGAWWRGSKGLLICYDYKYGISASLLLKLGICM